MLTVNRNQDAIAAKEAADFARYKAEAKAKVAAWADAQRRAVITVMPGQEMIYLAKEAEAARYVADPSPDMADYPFLAAEVGITAPTAYELAHVWLYMSDLWRTSAAMIEQVRIGLPAQIDAATTTAEVDAVLAALPL